MALVASLAGAGALFAACDTGRVPGGYIEEEDLARPRLDGGPRDLSGVRDLAQSPTADLSVPADLSAPADLAVPRDLARLPDLVAPRDLAAPPDLTPPLDYGRSVATGDLRLLGITDDGQAIVRTSTAVESIDIATGVATQIGPWASGSSTWVLHDVVFLFSNLNSSTDVGALSIWTKATGLKSVSTAAYLYLVGAIEDSSFVFYTTKANSSQVDLVLDTPDHAAPKTLVASVDLNNCYPRVRFTATRFVASHCPAGSSTGEVTSWDPATATPTTLLTGAGPEIAINPAETTVLVRTTAGAASLVPIAGGMASPLTTNVASGLFTSDGANVVYRTTSNALSRIAVSGGMPTTLQASGAKWLMGLSPDGKSVVYYTTYLSSFGGISDLYLSSTETAAARVVISSSLDTALYGPAFTDDSTHAVAVTLVNSQQVGTLKAQPTAGGAARTVSTKVWSWANAGGARVVFNDNYASTLTDATTDVKLVDLATANAATTLATGTRPTIIVPRDQKHVYFTVAAQGLFERALP